MSRPINDSGRRSSRGWKASAEAWISQQGDKGDWARQNILDPGLEPLLGNLHGKRILDVGCGEGRYCRLLAEKGAITTGLDPVEEFIALAKQRHPEGAYHQGFAEFLPFPSQEFDLVVSYLTLVDILDFRSAILEMSRVLKPDGRILVATISNIASPTDGGWVKDEDGRRLYRAVDRYMEEFTLHLEWQGISIENYHRPLSAIMEAFFRAGLVLTRFLEPLPPKDSREYADEFRAPNFQIMEFAKRA